MRASPSDNTARAEKFIAAGLGSIPGGGGEILVDEVRNRIAPLKEDRLERDPS